jgi:hypothetical protein
MKISLLFCFKPLSHKVAKTAKLNFVQKKQIDSRPAVVHSLTHSDPLPRCVSPHIGTPIPTAQCMSKKRFPRCVPTHRNPHHDRLS